MRTSIHMRSHLDKLVPNLAAPRSKGWQATALCASPGMLCLLNGGVEDQHEDAKNHLQGHRCNVIQG